MTMQAVIFDMDGVLIDSEPLWRRAEVGVYQSLGMPVTEEMLHVTTGLRIDAVVAHWMDRFPPQTDVSHKACEEAVVQGVVDLIRKEGSAVPGALHLLQRLRTRGVKIAIASSSYEPVIEAVMSKLAIEPYIDLIYSAQHERYAKPHPGVYLTTAEKLGVEPTQCVAIEDSRFGVLAAKAARMMCIVVPSDGQEQMKEMQIADVIVPSLADISDRVLDSLYYS